MSLARGGLLDRRFLIEGAAASGGMGTVMRGRDLHTDETVAIKLLRQTSSSRDLQERFRREAQVLSELRHPGIVSYIAHGRSDEGNLFLVMEWLQGEDLAHRMAKPGLTLSETLTLFRKVTDALAVAHASGIVHRDIKPSNLFLRDHAVEKVTLIDFGVSRRFVQDPRTELTRVGTVVGTPAYMSPEHARAQGDIGPAADIFSLGCILFECLTSIPPFVGEHVLATLARILFEEPPGLRSLRPEIPEALESLVARMLVKDPAGRIGNAAALAAALDGLGPLPDIGPPPPVERPVGPGLTGAELALVSVILAHDHPTGDDVPTIGDEDAHEAVRRKEKLRRALSRFDAQTEQLANGSLVVTLSRRSTEEATDQAAQAARCALFLKRRWPAATIALTTGLGALNNRIPIGDVIERATRILRSPPDPTTAHASPLLDEVTAKLLGPPFVLARSGPGVYQLRGEETDGDEARRLVGKPTPCVGREHELAMLDAALSSCIDQPAACAILVTGEPGIGKSRLRHEFTRRVSSRGGVQVLMGRGDPMSAGGSYGLLGQALRRFCGVLDGEPLSRRRDKLRQSIGSYLPADEPSSAVSFIGELCSIPFPPGSSPQLRAAHNDPKVMSDQISAALVAFLQAACARHPVLLILEDLHWGDALTVKLIGTALSELAEAPLMVLSLARPELKELFPRLWQGALQEIAVPRLSQRACERLIREVLGADVPRESMARIVLQAEGNALFLEELIRAVSEGKGDEMPATVLAMLQARIGRLPAGTRRALRAASIFGETFWRGGVEALLSARLEAVVGHELEELVDAEIILPHPSSRFPREEEYGFRHALIREAAYGFLTEDDRRLGHALAGEYLEKAGEHDPLVLAEHYYRSGERERALVFLTRAAIQALDSNDLQAALVRADRAISAGATGEQLGTLRSVQAWANFWSGNLAAAFPVAIDALELLPPGSVFWSSAIGNLFLSGGLLGRQQEMARFVEPFARATPAPDAVPQYVQSACALASIFSLSGDREKAYRFQRLISEVGRELEAHDPSVRGWMRHARNWHLRFLEPDPWQAYTTAHEGVAAFTEAGDRRMRATESGYVGIAQWDLGDAAAGEATLRAALETGLSLHEGLVVRLVRCYLAQILLERDDPSCLPEVEECAEAVIGTAAKTYYGGLARCVLARLAVLRGQLTVAEAAAREALAVLTIAPPLRPLAFAALIHVLLAGDRSEEALAVAEEGERLLESIGGAGRQELSLRLAIVEARLAAGGEERAAAAAATALAELQRRADTIPDPALRRRFLDLPPVNSRILVLAGRRGER